MLPLGATSSIQRRRQHHRRQQSLEVPIIAPPLPHQPRRSNPGHRRGLSLDQSLSAIDSSSGFRPLLSQDQHSQPTGSQTSRNPTDTNQAYPPDQQHLIKQETQEHSLAQPGFQQQVPPHAHPADFQSHLHQQLNGIFNPSVSAPNREAAAAMQSLQKHVMWYEQTFGAAASNPNMQQQPFVAVSHAIASDMAEPVFLSQPGMQGQPATQVPRAYSQTVPNTPQDYGRGWPSPPPSHGKHQRSHSYQVDVAPMPSNHDGAQLAAQFPAGSFSMSGEQDYAASVYSSSMADASSPAPHQHAASMPTLFEEPALDYGSRAGASHAELLLHGGVGGEHDFNSSQFMIAGGPFCPEQAALDAAGIDATYIDTGISEEQINSWLIHPVNKGDAFVCRWEGCGTSINRKENARSHVQNHLDDRRFRCNPCGKRFNRLHDTKRHHLTHTNERPAICPCGKTFARADALTRHRQRDMCEGVLPGFEKLEDEKPKRGRPKKIRPPECGSSSGGISKQKRAKRPDLDTRAKKAALARALDNANEEESAFTAAFIAAAGSVSSPGSDHSMPDTPPQDSDDLDSAAFLGISRNGGSSSSSSHFHHTSSSWLDTPPTSPPAAAATPSKTTISSRSFADLSIPDTLPESVSPSKLSTRSSPPQQASLLATQIPRRAGATTPSPLLADTAVSSPAHGASSSSSPSSHPSPSSPPSAYPLTDFTAASTPLEHAASLDPFRETFDFDAIDCLPEASASHDLFSSPLPAADSCYGGSSVYASSEWDAPPTLHVSSNVAGTGCADAFFGRVAAFSAPNVAPDEDFPTAIGAGDAYDEVRDLLDSWISTH